MKKFTKISAAIIATLALANIANAATPGAYVGIGLGDSILRTPTIDSQPGLSTSNDRGGLGGRLFAGYNFNKYAGIEGNYSIYANSTTKVTTTKSISPITMNSQAKYSLYALSVVGKGYLPISDSNFNAYVLGGLAEVRGTTRITGTLDPSSNGTTHASGIRPVYGVGASYDFPQHITTSLELSRIQGRGNMKTSTNALPNADMVSLNIGYNFG